MNRRDYPALSAAESAELDRLVREQAEDLEWLARVEQQYPLATSVLWTAPKAVCDQRRAVIGCMQAPTVGLIRGGWRSGKSIGLKQLTVAAAMGGDHPAVRAWLAVNGLPTDTIPDGPAQVYAIAQSSNDSIRYHRDDFDALVGPYGTWYNRNGKGEAQLRISIPGSKAVGKIWFKSMDQGRAAMQGISLRRAFIDEEPLGADGLAVFLELLARVADQDGQIGIAMIPREGITWVHDRMERDHEWDARVFELDALDNPHLPGGFAGLYAGMSDDDIASARFGRFRSLSGTVYSMFAAGNGDRWGPGHMCDDFEIPADWPRWRADDYGLVNPTACGWGALGDDDTLYVYREYYEPNGQSYTWHADQVAERQGMTRESPEHEWTGGESIECAWGDPASLEARITFNDRGLETLKANNDVKGGIDRVKDRLRIRADNRPRLKIFRSCTNLLRELPAYIWDPRRRDEVPVKKDDHSPDWLRYMVVGIHASR